MIARTRLAQLAEFLATDSVGCSFDERTGIMRVYFDDRIDAEVLPTDAEFMEMFAHHARGRKIVGLAIFPKDIGRKH